jgi:hypothetical protein
MIAMRYYNAWLSPGGESRLDGGQGMPRGRPRKNPDDVLIKSAEMLGWALGGIEREIGTTRERLAALTNQANQLRARLGNKLAGSAGTEGTGEAAGGRRRRRRKMSPEARKRISEMMKKRWAERKRKA